MSTVAVTHQTRDNSGNQVLGLANGDGVILDPHGTRIIGSAEFGDGYSRYDYTGRNSTLLVQRSDGSVATADIPANSTIQRNSDGLVTATSANPLGFNDVTTIDAAGNVNQVCSVDANSTAAAKAVYGDYEAFFGRPPDQGRDDRLGSTDRLSRQ